MTTLGQLPPILRSPEDPTSWLLNGRVGWHAMKLEASEFQQLGEEQSLALALALDSQRSLTEESGSFGGLTSPGNIALGPDGSIYLLDMQDAQLKRFDPCECQFLRVPCFGGAGSGPRQLKNPHGIAVCTGQPINLRHRQSSIERLRLTRIRAAGILAATAGRLQKTQSAVAKTVGTVRSRFRRTRAGLRHRWGEWLHPSFHTCGSVGKMLSRIWASDLDSDRLS